MIIKSKDVLVELIRQTLPEIDQISLEKTPDVSSGPGIKIQLDFSALDPVSGTLSDAVVGWRLSYTPMVSGQVSECYNVMNTLIESVFDNPVHHTSDNIPFKVTQAKIIRTQEGIFLKMILSTTLKQNTTNYDPMEDVILSTGG